LIGKALLERALLDRFDIYRHNKNGIVGGHKRRYANRPREIADGP